MAFRWLAKLVGRDSDSETPRRVRQKTFDELFAKPGLFQSVRPQSFFLTQINEAQVGLLKASGVACETTKINGRNGVLVKDISESASILSPINAEVLAYFPCECEGVTELLLKFSSSSARPAHRLTITDWNGENKTAFETLISQNFLPFLGCDVELSVPHKETRTPKDDNVFHIYVWSSPGADRSASTPEEIFGIPVDCRDESFYPSRRGFLVKDESGTAVAQLIKNCLYIHHDLVHHGTYNELGIFYRILQIVRQQLDFISELEQRLAELEVSPTPKRRSAAAEIGLGTASSQNVPCSLAGTIKSERTERIMALLLEKTILPLVNTPFQVECGKAGETVLPKMDGLFHIHFWASPLGAPCISVPEAIFGSSTEPGILAFLPSGQGVPIIEDGYAVAELLESNLYLHHKMRNFIDRDDCFLLLELCKRVRQELIRIRENSSRDGLSDPAAIFSHEQRTSINAIARSLPSTNIESQHFESARIKLENAIRVCAAAESSLLKLQRSPLEGLGKEFDNLLTVPQVRNITFKYNALHVSTAILYCRNPRTGNVHEIGAFDICIPLDTSKSILWFNLTRRVYGFKSNQNAPHIWSDGTACLGNAASILSDLRGKRDLAGAVMVAIAFVESVNLSDSAGKYLSRWPVVS